MPIQSFHSIPHIFSDFQYEMWFSLYHEFSYVWYCWCVFESSFLLLFLTYCALISLSTLVSLSRGLYAPKYCWIRFLDSLPTAPPFLCPLRLLLLLRPPLWRGPGWLLLSLLFSGFSSSLLTLPSCCSAGWHTKLLSVCISSPSLPVCLLPLLITQAGPSS